MASNRNKKTVVTPRRVGARPAEGASLGNIPISLNQLQDVHPDTIDFRDKPYAATLVEVPTRRTVEEYLALFNGYPPEAKGPVLDQGQEGACTGFGLAAVANYLLWSRQVVRDGDPVSPRMFYEMARRYDEWPGENYAGSSARGAMKGWHKHGVCAELMWPYFVNKTGTLTQVRANDAARRPLGAYFRVNHENLVSMHAALAEVGILYATAKVHEGWGQVKADGKIPYDPDLKMLGGHAFAIVGYDREGFWIQNSWNRGWGRNGFGLIRYDDWIKNASDVWVARLGAPVVLKQQKKNGVSFANLNTRSDYSFSELRSHVISIGNEGLLRPDGTFGTNKQDVINIVQRDMDTLSASWPKKRLLLYAHGGLVSEENALQRVEEYRKPLLAVGVYPLAFIWKTDFWTTLKNILADAFSKRKPEGFLDSTKDFLLDRLDDTLEPLARPVGKPIWSEMKENAALATSQKEGGAKILLEELKKKLKADPSWEIHVAGHSAGSIFMGPVVEWLAANDLKVSSLTLWAPACTMDFFKEFYLPSIKNKSVQRFSLFTLKDAAEQDDHCAKIYHKSLLYLVANALEEKSGLFFLDGEPLLGMEQFILEERGLFQVPSEKELQKKNPPKLPILGVSNAEWIRSPNGLIEGQSMDASHAREHGAFDDDKATVLSTLARITGALPSDKMEFGMSASRRRECRQNL
jgi:hypothetical protein